MSSLELLLIPLGFLVGTYGTLVGAGGGSILVPVLLLSYPRLSPTHLTSLSLLVVFFNAASGSVAYARLRRIDYLSGLIFAAAALPWSIAGAFAVAVIPQRTFDILLALLLLALAGYTWWAAERAMAIRPAIRGHAVITRTVAGEERGSAYRYSYNLRHGIAFSVLIGFISSLLGIGGGVVHVPIMIRLLHFPVHVAIATSQFVLAITSASGSAVHLGRGDLDSTDLVHALLLAIGVIPGAQVGARLAQQFRGTGIVRLLTVALAVLGLRLLYAGIR
ncbi:MAG: sulfite exporter TauE/SafE family protein [Dehalococcoidia bacterium]|nr:sulfite exporter TauE/SafE family protein [Dehalococcoidia bacterium]